MIKVKVQPKSSQLIIHGVITLLATTIDLMTNIASFAASSRLNNKHSLPVREKSSHTYSH